MAGKVPITVAKGDGIGPEIMDATMHILMSAGAQIEPEYIEVGEKVYRQGITTGIPPEAWESLRRTQVFLKAPITTPQGGGYKSLNVTTRKALGLYANVRPCVAYDPFIETKYPGMDVIIIRENEEDLYAGIEYQQTPQVVQALKLISWPGSEKIIRFAFEYARMYGRKKVTCFTKDNILKMSDGLFHKIFDQVAQEYPDIESEHWIVDIGMAKLADTPQQFDVVVMPNLYGDVGSDIAAQIAGSVGIAGSANIGDQCAMFEAIHGSAPRRAGQNLANPSGLLHGAIMMLNHIGQPEVAERIYNAWLRTLEDGIFTYDIAKGKPSVGTREFAQAVVDRLGKLPQTREPVSYTRGSGGPSSPAQLRERTRPRFIQNPRRELQGVDVFVYDDRSSVQELGQKLEKLAGPEFTFVMLSNRGVKVYPDGFPETFCSDQWRCRFEAPEGAGPVSHEAIRNLLGRIESAGIEWIKLENLYNFDGERAYSLDQGQ